MAQSQLMIKRPEFSRRRHDRSLVDQVVDAVTQSVIVHRDTSAILPSEGELARHYQVSRTVIREAMRLLSDRGIIEITHGKKPRICEPSSKFAVRSLSMLLQRGIGSLKDLAEVRIPLESEIAALAAYRRTAANVRALQDCLHAQASVSSLDEQVKQDVSFHNLLAESTGNVIFKMMLETVSDLLVASRSRTLGRVGNEKALLHHRRILQAVIAQRPTEARQAMIRHLQLASKDLEINTRFERKP
jgi:DNA-binding FadR family transcriptional regulator